MRYLDNLYKSMASAVSIILVVVLSMLIFPDVFVGMYFVLGTICVVLAVLAVGPEGLLASGRVTRLEPRGLPFHPRLGQSQEEEPDLTSMSSASLRLCLDRICRNNSTETLYCLCFKIFNKICRNNSTETLYCLCFKIFNKICRNNSTETLYCLCFQIFNKICRNNSTKTLYCLCFQIFNKICRNNSTDTLLEETHEASLREPR
uniref:Uncharacterized protein n=1 Tax=Caenorhabditis tropicalis TaxID=1561998 RepID=A0A1I7UJD2_9PELO